MEDEHFQKLEPIDNSLKFIEMLLKSGKFGSASEAKQTIVNLVVTQDLTLAVFGDLLHNITSSEKNAAAHNTRNKCKSKTEARILEAIQTVYQLPSQTAQQIMLYPKKLLYRRLILMVKDHPNAALILKVVSYQLTDQADLDSLEYLIQQASQYSVFWTSVGEVKT